MKLWNPHNGVMVKTYVGHGYDVRDAAVCSDNSKFASCGGDKQVFLWDVSTGRFLRKFKGHDGTVNAVAFGANDDVLISAGYDQCLKVWDCKSRSIDALQTIRDFKVGTPLGCVRGACQATPPFFAPSTAATCSASFVALATGALSYLHAQRPELHTSALSHPLL